MRCSAEPHAPNGTFAVDIDEFQPISDRLNDHQPPTRRIRRRRKCPTRRIRHTVSARNLEDEPVSFSDDSDRPRGTATVLNGVADQLADRETEIVGNLPFGVMASQEGARHVTAPSDLRQIGHELDHDLIISLLTEPRPHIAITVLG